MKNDPHPRKPARKALAQLMWRRDQPFCITTIRPSEPGFHPIYVLDASQEACAARREAVAKALRDFIDTGWHEEIMAWKKNKPLPIYAHSLADAALKAAGLGRGK